MTHIGDCAFWNCFSLRDVTIPESVKYIGDGVFWNCGDIDNVNNMNRETVSEYSKYEVTATDHLNLMQIVKEIYIIGINTEYGLTVMESCIQSRIKAWGKNLIYQESCLLGIRD